MTYASVQDVVDRLGRPTISDATRQQIAAWLADVEDAIATRFRKVGLDLHEQVALDQPPEATVVRVEANAVVQRGPGRERGMTSTTRSVDDSSITNRWEGADGSGDDWLTDADWADLLPAVNAEAYSTRPGFVPDRPQWRRLDWS